MNPDQLLQEHADELYRYALPRVRDTAAAERLLLETLRTAVSQKPAAWVPERDWLLQILRGRIVEHFRPSLQMGAGWPPPWQNERFFFQGSGEWIDHWTNDGGPVEWNDAGSEDLQEMTRRCLHEMPSPYFELLVLCEMERMRPIEVAALYRMQTNSVEKWLYAAREQLRWKLESRYFRKFPAGMPGLTAPLKC
jgi:DNA-directed RNA polymerase specialized sigma24 family protein